MSLIPILIPKDEKPLGIVIRSSMCRLDLSLENYLCRKEEFRTFRPDNEWEL
ncbi:hypothetical protein LEP1GSC161_1491 [Leptospira santarosai str. CBC1416]|uniref:Uncharacterized protein n=2 Tax=Leptospira santarosai TaxID=28183 RepID=A0A0E2BGT1_9LEPT|nr:hypothetical protein LEP1GSC179_3321 [Leptospira santarosai str. MOR084]EKR90836.1 hypothetical protein LEP1GSC163_3929 [Leptospira santarosai str. CBC379]EMJ47176.1 hypothetical protein LEP1GSC169_3733 [Leptospira santarosai str. HAI1349]EMO13904.1 hypothetical protein LEP1GSC165_3379 [Leptospira santarosai str. CBC523]EMO22145.1 hypothetical protein LEP1GSC168_2117 [Leptospira santarosai str. HAI134]EMO33909.1 hypothetical protein LEP1GSC175_2768 [Leptospira santarosai str. HAI821]EMO581